MNSNKNKILLIGPLPPPYGGVATNFKELLRLINNLPDIQFMVLNTSNREERELVNTITSQDIFLSIKNFINFLILLVRNPIDIVHIQSTSDKGFFRDIWFVTLGKIFRKKIVFHFHAANKGIFNTETTSGRIIYTCLNKLINHLVLLSPNQKKGLEKFINRDKMMVIPNITIVNKKSETKINDFRLLFLGRLSQQKGFFDLLHAISLLKNKNVPLFLSAGGLPPTKEDEETIKKVVESLKLNDYIKFHGILSGENKDAVFSTADIFVLPSYTEILPVSILEALGYGLGIITTRVGCLEEYIKQGQNCIFVNNQAEDIANAIMKLHFDREFLERMKQNNLDLYRKELDPGIIKDKLNEVYYKLSSV